MIFKIIILGLMCWFVIDTLNNIIDRDPPDNPEDENLPYQLIDEIAKERERVKKLEDLISVIEAYRDAPADEDVSISFADPSGDYKFKVKYSEELLVYLYAERQKTRTELSKKIKSFSN